MEDMRLVITRQAHLAGLDDEYVPITIARAESGLDPSLQKDGGYGLFQLHRGGLAQSSLSDEELLDPHVNASLAIRGMLGNYRAGVTKGLTGIALVQYVAYYSGWPTFGGPEHAAEAFPDYGKKLAAAYLEERNAEEADSGHIVTHPAPAIEQEPQPQPEEPKPEPVKEPEPAPVKEPEQEPPAQEPIVDNVVNNVDKTDYSDLSLHTGIPVDILKGYGGRVPQVIRVRANETFAEICGRYGVDAGKVQEVNRIDPERLYSGQVLYL